MNKIKLQENEVKHVANLANLTIKNEDVPKFEGQLSEVLDYVDKLQGVKTERVQETNQTTGLKNIYREDTPEPSLEQEKAMLNAPKKHNNLFKVKSVF